MVPMSVLVRQRKGREGWFVRVTVDGRTRWQKCESREQAEWIAEATQVALAQKSLLPKSKQPLPADEMLSRWYTLNWRTLKRSTRELASGLLKNHLVPYFGRRSPRDLNRSELLLFAEHIRSKGRGTDTVQNCFWILGRVCSLAVQDGLMTANPCAGIRRDLRKIKNAESKEGRQRDAWTARPR